MNKAKKTNLTIIEAVLGGNIQAYKELIVRYEKMTYTLAVLKLRDHEAAATVSQECFIQAYRELSSCRSEDSFPAAVYRICGDLIRNYYKNESAGVKPQESISNTPSVEIIRDALISMPEDCREIMALRDIGGLKYDQIARLTGLDEETVKNKAVHARAGIKQLLSSVY